MSGRPGRSVRGGNAVAGRPSKLAPELAHKVYEYVKGGASFIATQRALGSGVRHSGNGVWSAATRTRPTSTTDRASTSSR